MHHWRSLSLFVSLALGFSAPALAQDIACGARHLATIEADGSISRGAQAALLRAVGDGQPIRVGWSLDPDGDGKPDLTHWTDASFLTEFEGHVFAQIEDIQRQSPMRGQARVAMPTGRMRWTGILGTNARLEGHFDDGTEPVSVRVRTTWCLHPQAVSCAPAWRLVYRHDADGKPIAGTKQALLDAIRSGAALRLAWGFSGGATSRTVAVEHAAEPVFVTIMRGDHVFAQLPEHIAQASYADPGGARFDQASVMWRGLMGSDGTFDAVFVDRATGKEVRRLPQRAGLAWFAELPGTGCQLSEPLELAMPGGVRLDAPRPPGR